MHEGKYSQLNSVIEDAFSLESAITSRHEFDEDGTRLARNKSKKLDGILSSVVSLSLFRREGMDGRTKSWEEESLLYVKVYFARLARGWPVREIEGERE